MSDTATVIEAADPPVVNDPPANDPPVSNDPPAADPPADPPAGDPPADPPADDWRARLAGDDKKLLGYLARVPSEKELVARVKKHEDDLKAGKYLKPLGENPSDEEVAEWRKNLGVPEKPEDYQLADGLVVGDDDKPFVDKFLGSMHAAGAPPAVVNAALDTYYAIVEEQVSAEVAAANTAKSESIETLREEWGGDYKRNLNAMHGYLDTLPEAVASAFRTGKGADGVPLGYNADVLKWLTAQALEANPLATVVPGAGANQASAIADELAQIREVMRTDRAKYNADQRMQERYRELITAEQKLKGQ